MSVWPCVVIYGLQKQKFSFWRKNKWLFFSQALDVFKINRKCTSGSWWIRMVWRQRDQHFPYKWNTVLNKSIFPASSTGLIGSRNFCDGQLQLIQTKFILTARTKTKSQICYARVHTAVKLYFLSGICQCLSVHVFPLLCDPVFFFNMD